MASSRPSSRQSLGVGRFRELRALAAILVAYVVANVAIVAARPAMLRGEVAAVGSALARDRGRLDRGLLEWKAEMLRDGRWLAAALGPHPEAFAPADAERLRGLVDAQVPTSRVWLVRDGRPVAVDPASDPPTRRHLSLAALSVARDSALLAATEVRGRDLRVAVAVPVRTALGAPVAVVLDVSASRLRERLPDVAWRGHGGRTALTFPYGTAFVGASWSPAAREPEISWPRDGWTLDDSSLIVVGGALADTTPRFQLAVPRAAAAAVVETRAAWLHAGAALVTLPACVGVLLVGRARHDARLRAAEAAATRAELAAVQARLDPHFLSNALHSVAALVDSDPGAAEEALDRLGDLFRYSVERSERHTVRLGDEWRFVRDYLAIEQMRLGARLTVVAELDPDAEELEVPSLVLQPLVENAVRHGVVPRREGGTVRVSARLRGERVELSVADDGAGADPTSIVAARGTGLRTLRQRLELDGRFDGRLAVDTAPGAGFRARVTLGAVR